MSTQNSSKSDRCHRGPRSSKLLWSRGTLYNRHFGEPANQCRVAYPVVTLKACWGVPAITRKCVALGACTSDASQANHLIRKTANRRMLPTVLTSCCLPRILRRLAAKLADEVAHGFTVSGIPEGFRQWLDAPTKLMIIVFGPIS